MIRQLWNQIISQEYSSDQEVHTVLPVMFTDFVDVNSITNHNFVVDDRTDELSVENLKFSHRVGVSLLVKWVPTNHGLYDGVFCTGTPEVLLRISIPTIMARPLLPTQNTVDTLGLESGLSAALKVMVPWSPVSENIVFLPPETEQAHIVEMDTHHGIRFPYSNPLRQTLSSSVVMDIGTFAQVSSQQGHILLDSLAPTGMRVPHSILLVPTDALCTTYYPNVDLRTCLSRLGETGVLIYHILDDQGTKLGELHTISRTVASRYADHQLHFHHHLLRDRNFPSVSGRVHRTLDTWGVSMEDAHTFYIFSIVRYIMFPETMSFIYETTIHLIQTIPIVGIFARPLTILAMMVDFVCGGPVSTTVMSWPARMTILQEDGVGLADVMARIKVPSGDTIFNVASIEGAMLHPLAAPILRFAMALNRKVGVVALEQVTSSEGIHAIQRDLTMIAAWSPYKRGMVRRLVSTCAIANGLFSRLLSGTGRYLLLMDYRSKIRQLFTAEGALTVN